MVLSPTALPSPDDQGTAWPATPFLNSGVSLLAAGCREPGLPAVAHQGADTPVIQVLDRAKLAVAQRRQPGSGGILLANRSWQRQAYRITELQRWRSRLGIPVNIEPKFFPADVDLASCMVIATQRRGAPVADFVNAVMRAIWAEDRNVADPGVLVAIAGSCGLDGRTLLGAADAEAVRAEYRGNTDRALAAGVFGSPFYLFAGELFWGQDRLDMLEEAIVRSASGDLGRGPG